MRPLRRLLTAIAPTGRGAVASRHWALLLALLLSLQGFAWSVHAASHSVPAAACSASAVADDSGDAHCGGGACVHCHALSLFDGAPTGAPALPPLTATALAPQGIACAAPARRALPWARSRAPPVSA